jgi:tRNA 2-thiouridine synthesizing protein A
MAFATFYHLIYVVMNHLFNPFRKGYTMNLEELKNLKVDRLVDARGTSCPGPLLEAKRGMTSVPMGGIMEVLSSDEGTCEDIPLWSKKVGHEYLGFYEESGVWHIFVTRGK